MLALFKVQICVLLCLFEDVPFHHPGLPEDTMMVTVVYDNSEATELCADQHLYFMPIAKLIINVWLPESTEPMRHILNWGVLDQLKSLICTDQLDHHSSIPKSTKYFI